MSMQIGFVLLAAAAGIAVGLVVAARRVGPRPDRDDLAAARIHGQLEAQGAELRRLADATAGRDLTAQDHRTGLEDARRALEGLQLQEQERRGIEDEQREVVRRLATVLAGGPARGR